MITKINITKLFLLFIVSHLVVWILIPSLSNKNLPLDTIEALAWGSNLDWGFDKHPPMSAFAAEVFYQIFGNQDWAYYALSQIFVVISFIFVWKLSEEFFEKKIYSLISVLFLVGVSFFNFTTPEFNVNVCELPFWAMTVYYAWQSTKNKKNINFILLGIFAGLGFLSKYLFVYLLLALVFFITFYSFKSKKLNFKYLLSIVFFFITISPHLIWLVQNNFVTIFYGLNRTGLENSNLLDHLINPIIFISKQILVILPGLLLLTTLIKKFKYKFKIKDFKLVFLIMINFIPIILVLLTSIFTGAKIRTMWMTPFYLFLGLFLIYLLKEQINFKKIKLFMSLFLFLFILSPSIYLYISITNENKRTDYPGKEISYLVQTKWNENFENEISVVVGDEWVAGNLSYHLSSRPKWYNTLDNNLKNIKKDAGFVYAGNPEVLKKICPGVYGTIKPIGFCMIGSR